MTREVRHSERAAYEKLIRVMSHEVNNTIGASNSLLNTCLVYSEFLPEEEREDYTTAINVVVSRTENLNRFMREYANVIRLPEPNREATDVVALLRDISVLMSSQCAEHGIEWCWQLEITPQPISMDQHQMEQVFLNIVKNAIEAIGESGRITVRLSEEDGAAVVQIMDSGRLTAEVKEQLFSPFFSTRENGQGIGLTLVGDVLSRHGFDYALEGGPDRDTCFLIRFTTEG